MFAKRWIKMSKGLISCNLEEFIYFKQEIMGNDRKSYPILSSRGPERKQERARS